MQKIVVKNFGPIEDAEIDIKKILVLIGEQASGKSTIAKLIYFFQSLRDEVILPILKENETDIIKAFENHCADKFLQWFGLIILHQEFHIRFYYDLVADKYISIAKNENKIIAIFSPMFFDENSNFFMLWSEHLNSSVSLAKNPIPGIWSDMKGVLNLSQEVFKIFHRNKLFVIANRVATVGYSEAFEREFFRVVENNIINNPKTAKAIVDDILTSEFLRRVLENTERMKYVYEAYKATSDRNKETDYLPRWSDSMSPILKGNYMIEQNEERIESFNRKQSISLSQASSGQQAAIRILQDTLLLIDEKSKYVLRIIEEPEAHLFPVAQKHIIELLALMVKQNEHNQLIITTHSPYILSVFNNLLFAERVVAKNKSTEKEVEAVIDKDFWLNSADFAAYSLNNRAIGGEQKYCESIVSEDSGMIAQNYLDTVSAMLGGEFNKLYSIHAKTFARK